MPFLWGSSIYYLHCFLSTCMQGTQSHGVPNMEEKNATRNNVIIYIVNLLLVGTIVASSLYAVSSLRLFNIAWTTRSSYLQLERDEVMINNEIHEKITRANIIFESYNTFSDADVLDKEMRDKLRNEVFLYAGCIPVVYNGAMWRNTTVSPFCDCLSEVHTSLENGVVEAMGKNESTGATYSALKSKAAEDIRDGCMKYTRGSIIESSYDPDSVYSSSLAMGTLLWNTIAFLTSAYLLFQSDTPDDDNSSLTCQNCCKLLIQYLGLIASMVVYFAAWWAPVAYEAATSQKPLGVLTFPITAHFIFVGWVILFLILGNDGKKNIYMFKSLVYWLAYSINVSTYLTMANAIQQRRDTLYQILHIFLSLAMAACGLASDYAQSLQATFARDDDRYKRIFDTAYNYLWLTGAFIALGIANVSDTSTVPQPSSNAQACTWLVLPLMLLPIILLPNGFMSVDTSKQGSSSDGHSFPKPSVFQQRQVVDAVARLIFTLAIATDIFLSNTNNNTAMDIPSPP